MPPALTFLALSAALVCLCDGNNATPKAEGDILGTTPPAEEAAPIAPDLWTTLVLSLEDGAKQKTVKLRNNADEREVFAVIAKSGVSQHQTSDFVHQWKLTKLHEKSLLAFNPLREKVFQRFLRGMSAIAEEKPIFILETGKWDRASLAWIAEHLLRHPMSLLVSLDAKDGWYEDDDSVDAAFIKERIRGKIERGVPGEQVIVVNDDPLQYFAGLVTTGLSSCFDVVYLDASHEMKDVLGPALLSFHLLKVGGIMIFDDYWMNGVARATAAFEEAFGDSVEILYREKDHLVVAKAPEDSLMTL